MRAVPLLASLDIAPALFQLIAESIQVLGRVERRFLEVVQESL